VAGRARPGALTSSASSAEAVLPTRDQVCALDLDELRHKLEPHMSYLPRSIRFLSLEDISGWRVKLYGIRDRGDEPERGLIDIARDLASRALPQPSVAPARLGCALVIVHQAAAFNQILVDWWEEENELRHHVFKASPHAPTEFHDITATGEAFCVWELRILAHEREAWIRHALRPSSPDVAAYLNDTLTARE